MNYTQVTAREKEKSAKIEGVRYAVRESYQILKFYSTLKGKI